jgi:hypothetical protein
MNMPEPSSKRATRVRRAMMLKYRGSTSLPHIGGSGAHGQVEVRVLQAMVQLGQDGSQNAAQINNFFCTDIAEAGHVTARINVCTERGGDVKGCNPTKCS